MAKVVVLSNRTTLSVTATLLPTAQLPENITLAPGEAKPFFFDTSLRVRYRESRVQREFDLQDSNAYFFTYGTQVGAIRLEEIGLGNNQAQLETNTKKPTQPVAEIPTIRVKLLVDDDEPAHQHIWEERLRDRFSSAAAVIRQHSGVQMVVDSVSTWDSQDNVNDFNRSLLEFEQEVSPSPAQLAIGFSSQYQITRGRVHLGGTRGALHPYILMKERSPQLRETERVELLVHELGHFLGAAHSPENYSVMRPLMVGGQQRAAGSRIRFDPVNTLLVAMVGDDIRSHGLSNLAAFSPAKKKRMSDIYGVLAIALPKDPAAATYQRIIGQIKKSSPLVEDTRQILNHLTTAARLQQQGSLKLKTKSNAKSNLPSAYKNNDKTTNSHVRQAAFAALRLDSDNANRAFLLALGIFMDESATLRTFPPSSSFVRQVESDAQRVAHLQVLGAPTMRNRRDLVKHFFISAFTVVPIGGEAARKLGLAKELADAKQGTGFSFADMAANRAGIIFAEKLLDGSLTLKEVSQRFTCKTFLPPIDDLPENLNTDQLQTQFDGATGKALTTELKRIETLILELPAYQ